MPEPFDIMKIPSRNEQWDNQLEQFPSEAHIRALVPLLRTEELREIAIGIITDTFAGCNEKDLLKVAENVNGWVATAEEYVEFRKKRHHIVKARESMGDNP